MSVIAVKSYQSIWLTGVHCTACIDVMNNLEYSWCLWDANCCFHQLYHWLFCYCVFVLSISCLTLSFPIHSSRPSSSHSVFHINCVLHISCVSNCVSPYSHWLWSSTRYDSRISQVQDTGMEPFDTCSFKQYGTRTTVGSDQLWQKPENSSVRYSIDSAFHQDVLLYVFEALGQHYIPKMMPF